MPNIDDDAFLKIAKGDFRSTRKSGVQLLKFSEVIFAEPTIEKLMESARNQNFLELEFLKSINQGSSAAGFSACKNAQPTVLASFDPSRQVFDLRLAYFDACDPANLIPVSRRARVRLQSRDI